MHACDIEGCFRPHRARGWCHVHYERWRRTGEAGGADLIGRRSGPEHYLWAEQPSYSTAHKRLRARRGSATEHTCSCGAQAEQWAYDKQPDPQRLYDDQGRPYSTDLDRYVPLCVPCHVRADLNLPTHCKHGHEFTESNTYVDPHGARRCRTCRREGSRRQVQKATQRRAALNADGWRDDV